jgi:hypothetical protein
VYRLMLIGPQRSGKSTVAAYLSNHYSATEFTLAEPIKDIAVRLYGMEHKDRGLLIGIGEALRSVDPLVFCRHCLRRIEEQRPEFAVVSDVRLPVEWGFFAQRGFRWLTLRCPLSVRVRRPGFDVQYVDHYTEVEWGLDPAVDTDCAMTEMFRRVQAALKRVFPDLD